MNLGRSPPPEDKPSIVPILTVNFVGTLGFSIVLPFLVTFSIPAGVGAGDTGRP